jgi:uncharacterized protein YcbK (DUF882 family)
MHSAKKIPAVPKKEISRRSFLKTGLLTATGLSLPVSSLARVADTFWPEKALSFYNTHTGERLRQAIYWAEGDYIPDTLDQINHLLRDHRNDTIKPIDPALIDLLHALSRQFGAHPIHVISGFRSPASNLLLLQQTQGVAKRSLHMSGKAADIRIPGCDLSRLRRAAMAQKRGGVGFYPDSNFIHLDTGRVRYW